MATKRAHVLTNAQASQMARRIIHPMLRPGEKLPVALSNALGRIVKRQVARSSMSQLDKQLRREQLQRQTGVIA